ncbi:hypothetical protein [Dysgonomonas sp. 216]|uniref:hypothetical protein n=1 Tax=Dysgonomonas sp. 216 TaxID=2302934 RepID=UPI0013D742A7|nr:hypothetical protein [Dysgonomonas sp. 216]
MWQIFMDSYLLSLIVKPEIGFVIVVKNKMVLNIIVVSFKYTLIKTKEGPFHIYE